jgi:TrpR family trp operon transcriptional repressor
MSSRSLQTLITNLEHSTSQKVLKDFLVGILTPKEIEEIAVRIEIIKQLKKGIPQQQIAKKLQVGIATVTRGSKELQKGRFSTWRNA